MSIRAAILVSGALHAAVAVALWERPLGGDQPAPQAQVIRVELNLAGSPPQPAVATESVTEIAQTPQVEPEPLPEATPKPVVEDQPAVRVVQAEAPPEPPPRVRRKPVTPVAPPVAVKPKPAIVRTEKTVSKVRPVANEVPTTPGESGQRIAQPSMSIARRPVHAIVQPDPSRTVAYLAELRTYIERVKHYPRSARRRGEQGTVMVSFVIEKNGRLSGLAIAQSSGHRRLDDAALKTLRQVSPFQPIPDALHRDRWEIKVPIAFSLRG